MTHYIRMTTDELHTHASEVKQEIRRIERKGAIKLKREGERLKNLRSIHREIIRELAKREVQLKLF